MRYRDRITAADLVLVSFPKSGRTWIRWFLQTYYQLVADVPFDLANPLLPAGRDLPPMAFTEDYFDVYADEPGRPYILFRKERLVDAQIILEQAVKLDPQSANAHNQLGLILAAQRQENKAREMFRKALAIDPDHKAAKENLDTLDEGFDFIGPWTKKK